jgi:hypothetical protein
VAREPVEPLIAAMSAKARLISGRPPGCRHRLFDQGAAGHPLTTEHARAGLANGARRASACPGALLGVRRCTSQTLE